MDPLTNDERIAALLDGRLSEQERAELLAELGASDDELELLVDSAGITRELEEEDRGEGIIPITAPRPEEAVPARVTRPPVWRRPAALALAAAAVLVIGIAPFAWKNFARADHQYLNSSVAAFTDPDAGIPAGFEHAFSETRGDGGAPGRAHTAVRFGALTTDLDQAVRAGDEVRAKAYANEVADLLSEDEPLSGRKYRQLAAREELPPADSLAEILEGPPASLPKKLVDLGAWAEAARIAVRRKDKSFFVHPESTPYIRRRTPGLDSTAQAALDEVRRAARPKADGTDWNGLEEALTKLLKAAT